MDKVVVLDLLDKNFPIDPRDMFAHSPQAIVFEEDGYKGSVLVLKYSVPDLLIPKSLSNITVPPELNIFMGIENPANYDPFEDMDPAPNWRSLNFLIQRLSLTLSFGSDLGEMMLLPYIIHGNWNPSRRLLDVPETEFIRISGDDFETLDQQLMIIEEYEAFLITRECNDTEKQRFKL